jgi:hypothetical protein
METLATSSNFLCLWHILLRLRTHTEQRKPQTTPLAPSYFFCWCFCRCLVCLSQADFSERALKSISIFSAICFLLLPPLLVLLPLKLLCVCVFFLMFVSGVFKIVLCEQRQQPGKIDLMNSHVL